MSKTYILLGRHGDICALLPMFYALHQRGEKNRLVVSSEFISLMDGVSYIEPIVHHGKVSDLQQAMRDHPQATVCQVVGPPDAIREARSRLGGLDIDQTDSHIKEAWRLAGHYDLWKSSPPLVFDRRDKVREDALVAKYIKPRSRVVLVALGGHTVPFPYADMCRKLIDLEFGRRKGWQVIDVSAIKADRIYDLLGLYEKAHVLVAADSAPLHLAAACPNLPVVALVNDQPTYWHGSPWRPNHIWQCRYADFPVRGTEMLLAIDNCRVQGSQFYGERSYPKLIHVRNRSEENADNADARKHAEASWWANYINNKWIFTPIDIGTVGKDSTQPPILDRERHPAFRSVAQLGLMRCRDHDRMLITRTHTCFNEGITDKLMTHEACYAHRVVNGQHNPATDLFCATKGWWEKHWPEIPDLIWGRDQIWASCLHMLFRKHGAVELVNAVYKH
jgi:hypothetical protein